MGIFTAMDEANSDHTAKGPIELLVIEDNEHYAAALRNNLEIEGFVVDVAHDGVLGMLRIRQRVPKLVILDVMLPGRDGYDVLRSLRDEWIQVPVVLLTARKDEADKLRGFGLGADDYITKPVSILELIARIRAVLRRAHGYHDEAPGLATSRSIRQPELCAGQAR